MTLTFHFLEAYFMIHDFAARGQNQNPSGVRQGAPPPRQDLHTGFRTGRQFANEQTPGVNPQGFRSTHTQSSRNASGM
jgi:hypothetical protein